VAGPSSAELSEIQARLERILDPYRDRLELASIYNIPTLRRRGATAHQWFAFVKPAKRHVGFYLLPVHTWPELLQGTSPELAEHLTGKATFTFRAIDEPLLAELDGLVARAFEQYMAADTGANDSAG
jgi:hypothetical protein